MTTVSTNSEHPTATADAARPGSMDDMSAGNLDKVREILFGGQMRDNDRRFARLEERLARDTGELRDDVRKRVAALEQFVRDELSALTDRLRQEHEERTEGQRTLGQQLNDAARAFEKKTAQIDDQLARAQRDLRQQLLDIQQGLSDDLKAKADDVMARLAHESGELRNDKADRSTIAALLTEMAMRLNNELTIPRVEE
jgi:DNA anti-recombination protein RmuC